MHSYPVKTGLEMLVSIESQALPCLCTWLRFFFGSTPNTSIFETVSPPPVPGLALQKCADSPKVPLVAEEVGHFLAFGPELDSVR